ncbi:putative cyclin-dependent serine/threonine-protein kinase DDB_G0272797/DDB_G0274007 [Ochlerotatus camptorhynchus]|uniref:putative cyclin-dependent serine/threonine-protein kinase DDB_G0272797/DDB_G0274007 n=1 Tax=Ochlerotatus camptorhynchus TaxID=644619 RepID=UPI0031DD8A21
MRLSLHLIGIALLLFCAVATAQQQFKSQAAQFSNAHSSEERENVKDSTPAGAANVAYRARPAYSAQYSSEEEEDEPQQVYNRRQHHPQDKKGKKPAYSSEEVEAEEEPDRLSLLLEKSDFHCTGRTTGYYADESLGCEVFHYCQENQKHSWICPEGFSFHQVHLICMPPSSDNICEQSSKYHFVNDYLYKPINMEEHMSKPNVTLRYSERYYPESFYVDERHNDYDRQQRVHEERRQPVQQQKQQYHVPQQQQQQQQIRKQPAYNSPTTPSYRLVSSPSPTHQSAYRNPEEINISLQQRRPTYSPTTQRYEEDDEYGSYERK